MIRKLLVANRGEIARRIFRTAHAMGISTVAVYSEPDADAPFGREADVAVALAGASPADTYLNVERIVEAAVRTGADAIHPGYGFLSENAAFARACGDAGLVFVGPSPDAIASMGSKLEAKARMEHAGVPVLPGGEVTDHSADALAMLAAETGYPLLVKASAGGGGRGMRLVRERSGLHDAVAAATREARAAFGDGTVFLERYVEAPRHVEIQIVGDSQGRVVHLFERECSIQRRHQKIVEECPSPAVDDALRATMGAAAVAAAKAIGYVGAGSVEFVLDAAGDFWFLEMNTRLQVEHPITELVTGLDIVRLQLLVASGQPLPPEALTAQIGDHAIEARLYAEDPAAGYMPTTGTLHRFAFPDGVRVDSGYEDGSVVPVHYDAMLAKVIAHAPTREEAISKLSRALRRAKIHGVVTNRDLLASIVDHAEFWAGRTDTHFLERNDVVPCIDRDVELLHAVAASQAARVARAAASGLPRRLPSGWRNNFSQPQEMSYEGRSGRLDVRYVVTRDGVAIEEFPCSVVLATPECVELLVDGVREIFDVHLRDGWAYVDSDRSATAIREHERFPRPDHEVAAGSLAAPMPGIVLRVDVAPGDEVSAGATLVVMEAMKTEHAISAPHGGIVADVFVAPGQQVSSGDTLVVVDCMSKHEAAADA